jgi:hypothetical protein
MIKRFNIVATDRHIAWLNKRVAELRSEDSKASYSSAVRELIDSAMALEKWVQNNKNKRVVLKKKQNPVTAIVSIVEKNISERYELKEKK